VSETDSNLTLSLGSGFYYSLSSVDSIRQRKTFPHAKHFHLLADGSGKRVEKAVLITDHLAQTPLSAGTNYDDLLRLST